ncbi:MAG: DUF4286 family protein [Acidobacteria bacterium]|nr:DUF4286 family protein [Acidobacteriota bacterium]
MVSYEVRVEVREDLMPDFERYMTGKHLPEILATGCFQAIRFERREDGAYRSRYEAASRADLDRYLSDHTPRFRADFMAHFPEGCTVSREVWDELARFS